MNIFSYFCVIDNTMSILLRGYNWVRRFRHRCGYGVHSPSDFAFITNVVYEKLPYYAYTHLHQLRRVTPPLPHHREKTDKFFFRMVNFLQPCRILEWGTGSGLSTIYLSTGCKQCKVVTIDEALDPKVEKILSRYANITCRSGKYSPEELLDDAPMPLVHIAHTPHYAEIFESLLPHVDDNSCVVVSYPYLDKEKEKWWKSVINDERTGITFDLYDVGIVFFNKNRIKEHRIVNFL